MKDKILKLIIKYVDLKGMVKELINEVADEALQKVVDDTKTPFDNMAKDSMWPVLEEKLGERIDEKLDLSKLLKKEEKPA